MNLPNTAAQRACSLAAARANPLFYAVVAKDVVFGSAGTPRLAGYDADEGARFKFFEANAALSLWHPHLFRGHKGRNEPLFELSVLRQRVGRV